MKFGLRGFPGPFTETYGMFVVVVVDVPDVSVVLKRVLDASMLLLHELTNMKSSEVLGSRRRAADPFLYSSTVVVLSPLDSNLRLFLLKLEFKFVNQTNL